MDASEVQRAGLNRRDVCWAALLAAVTLGLRLIFLFHSPDRAWPHSILYEGDAPVWARWAVALGQAQPFEFNLPFRTPGVAWLLHFLGVESAPFTGVKILWCGISAATPAAVCVVLARFFTRRAALVAAWLCALSHGSFVLATSLNNETPYALALVLLCGMTLAWIERPNVPTALALGALHGVALLLRAEHVLLVALFSVYAAWRAWRAGFAPWRCAGHSALLGLVLLAVCAPWILRSHAATQRFNRDGPVIPYGSAQPPWTPAARDFLERLPAFARAGNFSFLSELARRAQARSVDEADVRAFFEREWGYTPEDLSEWTLVSSKGPLDFALANHPDAHGGFSRAALQDGRDAVPEFSFARPSHLRLVNHGYAVGWGFIRADFGAWLAAVREKIARFHDGATLGLFAGDWPHAHPRERHAVDLATPARDSAPVWRLTVLVTLLGGALIALRRRGGVLWVLVLAYKLVVVIAFYGYARQAVSIAPALFALHALAIDAMLSRFAPKAASASARWCAATALAALLSFAFYDAWNPPRYAPRSAPSENLIVPALQLGPLAFESVEDLSLDAARR
jgi:hypothetical protein